MKQKQRAPRARRKPMSKEMTASRNRAVQKLIMQGYNLTRDQVACPFNFDVRRLCQMFRAPRILATVPLKSVLPKVTLG